MIEKEYASEALAIQLQKDKIQKRHDICVILHLYYPNMWDRISSYLVNLEQKHDLLVTIPHSVNFSSDLIKERFPEAQVYRCENRGRDIAPFLAIFSAISNLGYKYVCKIHTKKSLHIKNGGEWQNDMLDKLLGSPKIISRIKKAFDHNPDWGIIGPQGHVVPHEYFWTQNSENVIKLANKLDIPISDMDFSYCAGSMFWFRPDALTPLLQLGLQFQDFETEQGQIDGTLAHAIERTFGMVTKYKGYKIAESNSQDIKIPEVSFQFHLLIQAFQRLEQQFSTDVSELNSQVSELNSQVSDLNGQVLRKERELSEIYRSKAWRLILILRRIRLLIFPSGSTRERLVRWIRHGGRFSWAGSFRSFYNKVVVKINKNVRKLTFHIPLVDIGTDHQTHKDTYVPVSEHSVDPSNVSAKVVAFYLPQFHPIPENDEWWGQGFTEWANVSKATPNFEGHYQPHLPGELGYYDLRLPEVQEQQIALAKKYGIYGFCFYYYWFAGKRLLERPVDQYLSNPHLDLPYCLCWANENWTRRWDGAEHDILIGQEYTKEQYLHFIQDIRLHFSDPRYIRVDGKPMLLVYRVNLLPDPQKAVEIWRDECRKVGIGEIYLVAVQSFGITDPRPYGFDAAVEFPPSYLGETEISRKSVKITNPNFTGRIFDYNLVVRAMLEKKQGNYTYFKTVMPAWDNTARKQNNAHIFINSSPPAYKAWLEKVVTHSEKTLPEDKRFIFINAWNEWAEGTHLEPDRKFGYAYLQATTDAIVKGSNPSNWTILFISHDAHRGGAQDVLINTIAWFSQHTDIKIKVLCLQGGGWLPRFKEIADTVVLGEKDIPNSSIELIDDILDFCEGKPDLIYGNTVAAGSAYAWLSKLGVPILTHFHEMESSIQKYGSAWIQDVVKFSSHYIACSKAVQDNLIESYSIPLGKISLVYSSVISKQSSILDDKRKKGLRRKLGLEQDKIVVFGCGIGMPFRKGADLFIQLGEMLIQKGINNFHLYWIGEFDLDFADDEHGFWKTHHLKLKKGELKKHVTFLGIKDNPREYLCCGDIFVLPSREDPFPLVALEAADCGLPILCFDEAGGMPDFVEDDAGYVVPYENMTAMIQNLADLIDDKDLRQNLGAHAREKFLDKYTVDKTNPHVLSVCRRVVDKKPRVSIIVPNYNHAPYLEKRLESIFNQSYKDYEVILLDDASSDNSLDVLKKYTHHADVQLVVNEQNTGSPFRQWLRGIDMAKGDILWIAESDDFCAPDFLETLLPAFNNPKVKLAYVNSNIVNEKGNIVGDYSETEYLLSLSDKKWSNNYQVSANQEVNDGLGVKNTLLNISSALIRRFNMEDDLRRTLESMHIAGDWYFIVNAIKEGSVHYSAQKLNSHRRHSKSVIARTVSERKLQDFFNEFAIVQKYLFQTYELEFGFLDKWEQYIRNQWDDFTNKQNFELISNYFPFEELKEDIRRNLANVV